MRLNVVQELTVRLVLGSDSHDGAVASPSFARFQPSSREVRELNGTLVPAIESRGVFHRGKSLVVDGEGISVTTFRQGGVDPESVQINIQQQYGVRTAILDFRPLPSNRPFQLVMKLRSNLRA